MVISKRILALGAGALLLLCLVPFVARAVRTDVSRDFPVYHNHGLPDLTIDPKRLVSQLDIVDRFFDTSSCEISKGQSEGLVIGASSGLTLSSSTAAAATLSSTARLIQTTPIIRSSTIRLATCACAVVRAQRGFGIR
jgi:hypothetical protein